MADKKEEKEEKEPVKRASVPIACGHQNKHFIPALKDGQPVQDAKLFCTLERGHETVRVERRGSKNEDISTYEIVHSAPYKTVSEGKVVEDIAYWSNAAGEEVK
jgi:hypothetical protein